MSLLISLRSEILKTKRTTSVYLCVLVAAIVPFILLMEQLEQDGITEAEGAANIWTHHFDQGFMAINFLVLPMFIIVLATLLPQIEFRNNTWKQVLASPQSIFSVFMSKFILFQVTILLCLLGFNLLMGASAWTTERVNPALAFSQSELE